MSLATSKALSIINKIQCDSKNLEQQQEESQQFSLESLILKFNDSQKKEQDIQNLLDSLRENSLAFSTSIEVYGPLEIAKYIQTKGDLITDNELNDLQILLQKLRINHECHEKHFHQNFVEYYQRLKSIKEKISYLNLIWRLWNFKILELNLFVTLLCGSIGLESFCEDLYFAFNDIQNFNLAFYSDIELKINYKLDLISYFLKLAYVDSEEQLASNINIEMKTSSHSITSVYGSKEDQDLANLIISRLCSTGKKLFQELKLELSQNEKSQLEIWKMILECVRNNVGKESSTEFFIKTFNEIFLTEEIEDFLQSFSIFSTGSYKNLNKFPQVYDSICQEFILFFGSNNLTELIYRSLITHKMKWKPSFFAVKSLILQNTQGPNLILDMIQKLIENSLEEINRTNLTLGFLLSRLVFLQNVIPLKYQDWFSTKFIYGTLGIFKNKKTIEFVLKVLTEILPYDHPMFLRVHLESLSKIHEWKTLFEEYFSLAKNQISDLGISFGSFWFSKTANSTIGDELDKILHHYTSTNKIPPKLMEATIFQFSWYSKELLPALLSIGEFSINPIIRDSEVELVRLKLINELHSCGKIPPTIWKEYQEVISQQKEKEKEKEKEVQNDISEEMLDFELENSEKVHENLLEKLETILNNLPGYNEKNQQSGPIIFSDLLQILSMINKKLMGNGDQNKLKKKQYLFYNQQKAQIDSSTISQFEKDVATLLLKTFFTQGSFKSPDEFEGGLDNFLKLEPLFEWHIRFIFAIEGFKCLNRGIYFILFEEFRLKCNPKLKDKDLHLLGLLLSLLHIREDKFEIIVQILEHGNQSTSFIDFFLCSLFDQVSINLNDFIEWIQLCFYHNFYFQYLIEKRSSLFFPKISPISSSQTSATSQSLKLEEFLYILQKPPLTKRKYESFPEKTIQILFWIQKPILQANLISSNRIQIIIDSFTHSKYGLEKILLPQRMFNFSDWLLFEFSIVDIVDQFITLNQKQIYIHSMIWKEFLGNDDNCEPKIFNIIQEIFKAVLLYSKRIHYQKNGNQKGNNNFKKDYSYRLSSMIIQNLLSQPTIRIYISKKSSFTQWFRNMIQELSQPTEQKFTPSSIMDVRSCFIDCLEFSTFLPCSLFFCGTLDYNFPPNILESQLKDTISFFQNFLSPNFLWGVLPFEFTAYIFQGLVSFIMHFQSIEKNTSSICFLEELKRSGIMIFKSFLFYWKKLEELTPFLTSLKCCKKHDLKFNSIFNRSFQYAIDCYKKFNTPLLTQLPISPNQHPKFFSNLIVDLLISDLQKESTGIEQKVWSQQLSAVLLSNFSKTEGNEGFLFKFYFFDSLLARMVEFFPFSNESLALIRCHSIFFGSDEQFHLFQTLKKICTAFVEDNFRLLAAFYGGEELLDGSILDSIGDFYQKFSNIELKSSYCLILFRLLLDVKNLWLRKVIEENEGEHFVSLVLKNYIVLLHSLNPFEANKKSQISFPSQVGKIIHSFVCEILEEYGNFDGLLDQEMEILEKYDPSLAALLKNQSQKDIEIQSQFELTQKKRKLTVEKSLFISVFQNSQGWNEPVHNLEKSLQKYGSSLKKIEETKF